MLAWLASVSAAQLRRSELDFLISRRGVDALGVVQGDCGLMPEGGGVSSSWGAAYNLPTCTLRLNLEPYACPPHLARHSVCPVSPLLHGTPSVWKSVRAWGWPRPPCCWSCPICLSHSYFSRPGICSREGGDHRCDQSKDLTPHTTPSRVPTAPASVPEREEEGTEWISGGKSSADSQEPRASGIKSWAWPESGKRRSGWR